MSSSGRSSPSCSTDTASRRHADDVPAGHGIADCADARSESTAASPPETTASERFMGRKASGSLHERTSNHVEAASRKRFHEKLGTPCTSRWLGKIVSPGARWLKKAIIL